MSKFAKKYKYPLFFLYLTFLFAVLYRHYIFGDAVYMFSDTGSDSMSSSYPIIMMVSRMLKEGNFSIYNLQFGLGESAVGTALQYVNPLKFALLLFGQDHFTAGILIQLYLQTLITGFAAFLYFRKVIRDDFSAFLSAAIWSFSTYIVLWSQNYSYGIAVMMFTLTVLLFQYMLESDLWRWKLLLIGDLGLFLFTNYYFYYMTAIFLILYTTGYSIWTKTGFKNFLRKFLALAFCGIFSALLGFAGLFANLKALSGSARAGVFSDTLQLLANLVTIRPKRAVSVFSRLFSPDLLGRANDFKGYANYYELAILCTSTLFFFALAYLISLRKYRAKSIFLWIILIAAAMLPLTGKVLLGASMTGRYTFMTCFLECLYIGLFVREWQENKVNAPKGAEKRMLAASICASLFILASMVLIFFYDKKKDIHISKAAFLSVLFPAFCYLVALNCKKLQNAVNILLVLIVAGELLLLNNGAVNRRLYLTRDLFDNFYYDTDIRAAAEKLEAEDASLYRIYGGTDNAYYSELNKLNLGMVNGYNSTTARFNTPSAAVVSLAQGFDVYQSASSYFEARYEEYPAYTFLAGKYLLVKDQDTEFVPDEALFEKIDTINDVTIYENKNALPFGYLYDADSVLSAGDYQSLSSMERMAAAAESYYYTNSDFTDLLLSTPMQNWEAAPLLSDSTLVDLPSTEINIQDTENNFQNMHKAATENGWFYISDDFWGSVDFHLPDDTARPSDTVRYFRIDSDKTFEAENSFFNVYYRCGADDDFHLYSTFWPDHTNFLPEGVTDLRLQIQNKDWGSSVSGLWIGTMKNPSSLFADLKNSNISSISFAHDTYKAAVTAKEDGGMLCVPLLYSENWSAKVDGKNVEIQNINGGLVGIKVPAGTSSVSLHYSLPNFKLGICVSLISLAAYLVLIAVTAVKGRKCRKGNC